jgi:hypothetical protein
MPKGKIKNTPKPPVVVDAPPAAGRIEALVHKSQDFAEQAAKAELAGIEKHLEALQPERKRLETALDAFNKYAPTAKKQLQSLEGFRWHGGTPPANLRELLERQRANVFGGAYAPPADVQITALIKRINNAFQEIRHYAKETGQRLDYCARLIVSEICGRVSGIVPISGRDIPDIMRRIDETFQRFAEADLEARRQASPGSMTTVILPTSANDITIETNLNHGC